MGLFNSIRLGSSAAGDYEIERSLRFNAGDSPNLFRDGGSEGNRKTFTVSVWIKRSSRGEHSFWDFYTNDSNRTIFQIYFGYLRIFSRVGGSTQISCTSGSNMQLRDYAAWYHFVYAVDTTQSTQADRVKMYINGVQQTVSGTLPSQNADTLVGSTNENRIGCQHDSAGNEAFFDGYMAEFNYIDGQQLTPSSFAKTDGTTGEYKAIEYSGSYGTRGYYLNFSDNSGTTATTLGKDSSGNGNNLTPNNFSVASGKEGDSFADTPTNNFCTLNRVVRSTNSAQSLSNGNLTRSGSSHKCVGTFILENNKYYFEIKAEDANGNHAIGVCQHDTDLRTRVNTEAAAYFAGGGGEYKIENNAQTSGMAAYGNGDIIGIAIDTTLSTPKIWFAKNNSWQLSGDPANGTNGLSLTAGKKYVPTYDHGSSSSSTNGTAFFGAHMGGFNYDPPTGFVAASSANLPDPSIKLPAQHFNTLLYTGNDSNDRDITGVGFQPDFTWIKNREGTDWHQLVDAVRGANKTLFSNTNDGEDTDNTNGHVNSFLADGFNVSALDSGNVNENNEDFVAWNWNAGGSTASNSDGSITSSVRANTSAGFSIVSYTGTGSTATVGHGLGVAPDAIIVKNREDSNSWNVYHVENAGATPAEDFVIYLDQTTAKTNQSSNWNDTAPTSSVFTVGSSNGSNGSSDDMIAYCFSAVEGYSKFGSYKGNGLSSGTFVFTGFRPALIISKKSSGTDSWQLWDNKRDPDNLMHHRLFGNESSVETTSVNNASSQLDFYSNGFKWRGSSNDTNGNGDTYIYLAFAESPFKYSRAR